MGIILTFLKSGFIISINTLVLNLGHKPMRSLMATMFCYLYISPLYISYHCLLLIELLLLLVAPTNTSKLLASYFPFLFGILLTFSFSMSTCLRQTHFFSRNDQPNMIIPWHWVDERVTYNATSQWWYNNAKKEAHNKESITMYLGFKLDCGSSFTFILLVDKWVDSRRALTCNLLHRLELPPHNWPFYSVFAFRNNSFNLLIAYGCSSPHLNFLPILSNPFIYFTNRTNKYD